MTGGLGILRKMLYAAAFACGMGAAASPASAVTIEISGAGDSVDPMAGLGIFLQPNFTFSVLIDSGVADSGPGSNAFAVFEDAVTSFQVDGVELISTPNFVEFADDPILGEGVNISTLLSADIRLEFLSQLSGVSFGSGPFALTDLLLLEQSDFASARVFVSSPVFAGSPGDGTVTSFTISTLSEVPLPATAWLLLGGLVALFAAKRRDRAAPSIQ